MSEDMHDSETDRSGFPRLSRALADLSIIEQRYLEEDKAASVYQKRHKRIVAVAAVFGTLAIIFAILQLTLSSMPDDGHVIKIYLVIGEGIAVVLAAGAVGWGAFGRVHQKWLEHRHRAERYRFLKFACLISPDLLSTKQPDAKAWLTRLQAAMAEIAASSAHDWAVEENPHHRPPTASMINIEGAHLPELIDYYFQKRLRVQKRYFGRQSRQHDKSNWYTRLPPPLLFFASVLLALIHLLWGGITSLSTPETGRGVEGESLIAVALIAAAAILPVCGGGIRTARAAFEFSRHTLRFRAKYNVLSKLEESLQLHKEELARPQLNPITELDVVTAIFGDLWMCEHELEHEQREWLRLMIEAEWFA